MSQINPSDAENDEFFNYLNLPKLKDERVVALSLLFFKFCFGFSKYKAKTNPKTSRLRCVAEKTVNSDKHA